jgi:hypothetical protein
MINTKPEEFKRFLEIIPSDILANIWFIPLRAKTKDPDVPKGEKLKDPKYHLMPEAALKRIEAGQNVGIYALENGVMMVDVDAYKGILGLPQEPLQKIKHTLTIRTRNGGRQFYYINKGEFPKNHIIKYANKKIGEIRSNWYYGLAPGSYVKPDTNAMLDGDGVYTIIDNSPPATFEALPEGVYFEESEVKTPVNIDIPAAQTWKNDIGMPLYEIRKKDEKLDVLLRGAHECGYDSRSEADMATVQKLYWWRFTDYEIAGIIREYRPYEKTDRIDYLETTISKVHRVERYDPNRPLNGNNTFFDLGELPETHPQKYKPATLNLTGLSPDNFLIKYISFAARITDAYVDYHVGNGLWLLSVAADHKIRVRFAHETIYPNIWTFIIGDSTIARKTASLAIAYDKVAIPVFGSSRFLPQSSSPEALIEELSNAPRSSLVRDEAGGFLRELDKNYMQSMKDTLCTIYDNRDFHRKIRTSQRKNSQTDFNIKNPYLSLLFATTPDVFKAYTNLLDITSGWLVRFLYFTPDYEKEWKGYRKETIDDVNLRNDVRHDLELIKLRVDNFSEETDFDLTDEAMEFFTQWQKRTETEAVKNKDRNKLRILGRLHTYTLKIAMLFTLGDNNDNTTITKTYLEIACGVIENYFLITACNLLEDIGRDEQHNLQDKIIGILKTYGKVTIRDVLRYTHRPKKELAEALDALDERGSYEIKTSKSESGKTLFYELNGAKSNVTTVTSVTGVATVANVASVPEIKRIDVTVVTDDILARVADGNNQSFLCDKRDKSDRSDSSDSSDRREITQLKTETHSQRGLPQEYTTDLLQDIREKGKMWQDLKGPINSSNVVAFSMWYCEQSKNDHEPAKIKEIASKIFGITPDSAMTPGQSESVGLFSEECGWAVTQCSSIRVIGEELSIDMGHFEKKEGVV